MQEVTVKEVKLPRTEKSPTTLITEDGAAISGFDDGLKGVKPGAVLMVDLEVKGKYTNITAFETVKPGKGEPTPPDAGYKADPAKLASEELRSRMHAAKDLIIADKADMESPIGHLLRDWIMGDNTPQPSPEPRQPASKEKADASITDAKTKLLNHVKREHNFTSDVTAASYITKHYGISKERIDKESEKVLAEIQSTEVK